MNAQSSCLAPVATSSQDENEALPTHAYVALRDGVPFGLVIDRGSESEPQVKWMRDQGFLMHRTTVADAKEITTPGSPARDRAARVAELMADPERLVTVEEGHEIEQLLGITRSLDRFRAIAPQLGYARAPMSRRIYIAVGTLVAALTTPEPRRPSHHARGGALPRPVPSRRRP